MTGVRAPGINSPRLGLGLRVEGLGFRIQSSGCRVQGSQFRVQGSGCRVQDSQFRGQGSGFTIQGAGLRVSADMVDSETRNAKPEAQNPHLRKQGRPLRGGRAFLATPSPSAVEPNLKGVQDICLETAQAKARIWSRLSDVCRSRSTAGQAETELKTRVSGKP